MTWTEDPVFPDVPFSFMRDGAWVERFRGVWSDVESITILEARAGLLTVKHILRSQEAWGKRTLVLGDNLGSVLALSKGRACNHTLSGICRKVCVLSLAGNLFLRWRWIPSEWNRADKGSRGVASVAIESRRVCAVSGDVSAAQRAERLRQAVRDVYGDRPSTGYAFCDGG